MRGVSPTDESPTNYMRILRYKLCLYLNLICEPAVKCFSHPTMKLSHAATTVNYDLTYHKARQ